MEIALLQDLVNMLKGLSLLQDMYKFYKSSIEWDENERDAVEFFLNNSLQELTIKIKNITDLLDE